MKQHKELIPEFVEFVPPELKEGIIYISMIYGTAVHKCCCGCGEKVVTPFGPTDWKLIFDGSVSLDPSIGNWSFACKSHYFIRRNRVMWASPWSQDNIDAARAHDMFIKERYFETGEIETIDIRPENIKVGKPKRSLWHKLKKWLLLSG
jgi:hypothetical protein